MDPAGVSMQSRLVGLPRFARRGPAALRAGLGNMEALMEAMGRPHEALHSVHVAGTNGKGTVCSLLAAVSTASGRRTGLHTSPHLLHVRERMRIDGVPAPEDWTARAVERFSALFDRVRPSFFEATAALSLLHFAESGVDLAVVETGLGGRLDATNVLRPRLSVITHIDYDHTEVLGSTLEAIAREKAGIVKRGVPVLTAAAQPEVLAVLRGVAAKKEAELHRIWPGEGPESFATELRGAHQRVNVRLAVRAAELLFPEFRFDRAAVREGLRNVRALSGLRGRLERLAERPSVFADVAHNPSALEAALSYVRGLAECPFVLFGAMRDKDVGGMAHALAAAEARVYACALPSERAMSPRELSSALHRSGVRVWGQGSFLDGLGGLRRRAGDDDVCLITGSHLLVAAALKAYGPAAH